MLNIWTFHSFLDAEPVRYTKHLYASWQHKTYTVMAQGPKYALETLGVKLISGAIEVIFGTTWDKI